MQNHYLKGNPSTCQYLGFRKWLENLKPLENVTFKLLFKIHKMQTSFLDATGLPTKVETSMRIKNSVKGYFGTRRCGLVGGRGHRRLGSGA